MINPIPPPCILYSVSHDDKTLVFYEMQEFHMRVCYVHDIDVQFEFVKCLALKSCSINNQKFLMVYLVAGP